MKKQIHQDVYIGIVGLLFCAWVFYMNFGLKSGAGVMPLLLDGLLAVFSVIILAGGLKKSKLSAEEQGKKFLTADVLKYPLIAWGMICVYVLLFYLLGYLVSTGVMLLALMYFLKQRNWKIMIAIDVVWLVIVYVVFINFLSVNVGSFGLLGRMLR